MLISFRVKWNENYNILDFLGNDDYYFTQCEF